MAKLTCPECETVLRPTKPVAPGKKVKCPKCETVFAAPDEDEEAEEERPRKPAKKAPAKKAEKPAPAPAAAKKPASDDDDDGGHYGYIKDPDEEAGGKSKKEKVRYGPDTTVKDPRGPATTKLSKPTGYLQLVGLIGALGWVALIILITIPAVFPIKMSEEDKKRQEEYERIKKMEQSMPGAEKEKVKPATKDPPFFEVYEVDLRKLVIDQPWYLFIAAMIPFALGGCYSAMVVSGAISAQNLESRTMGIISGVMAILPLNSAGLGLVLAMVIHWLSWTALEDREFGQLVSVVVNGVLWLVSASTGGAVIRKLMDEEVMEGFTYESE